MSSAAETAPSPALIEAAPPAVVPLAALHPVPLFDRELSALAFNERVLAEARNPSVPLLERVKFLSICAHNLDEFFMIRVGEIRDLIAANVAADSRGTGLKRLQAVRDGARSLLREIYRCLGDELIPAMAKEGIRVELVADLGKKERNFVEEYFCRDLEPILTPLAIDPAHPFPFIANLSLNLALQLESERGERHVAIIKIPESVPRLVPMPEKTRFVLLEDVISSHVHRFFPGLKVLRSSAFRVIRNSDLDIKEEDMQDLLKSIEIELRRRERREVVWLEIEKGVDDPLLALLAGATESSPDDIFFAPGPLKLGDFQQLYAQTDKPALKETPFNPRMPAELATTDDIFAIIRRGDLLLHRPYDSFTAVIEFVQAATEDPDVVAIKQTLYRTDPGSPIIAALSAAARAGKQVTAVVELQARFDERKNITWARTLEEAGVQVVYGIVGYKTHCKVCLIVRREAGELRRYVHLSTGNYNAVTGRLYTDVDLFTCDRDFGADAAQLMNLLTGFSVAGVQELVETKGNALRWREFVVSPIEYLRWTIRMIDREAQNAAEGKPAFIVARMNALADPSVIEALYHASRAGVQIDLLVRGICCLVPGIAGVSENIRVISIIDRFLEHARIFRFANGGAPEVWMSSGDWMPRNFLRRIETTFPVRDEAVAGRISEQILHIALADNVKAWTLEPDGGYRRRTPGDQRPIRSQEMFISIARADSVSVGPYEESIRHPASIRRKAKKKKKH
ncbi:MAG: polyphosphate kinase 1 [Acidobacteria bacterium]|nr:polyphosphate kinase 1 [Acidobacteriota bacterium]MBV9067105.1 polyphosphate kinase 1 [Acidobacteriota bacterium]MBV9183993.1 polyphosphate kinase 1 [Acidobacteriota bacterium]